MEFTMQYYLNAELRKGRQLKQLKVDWNNQLAYDEMITGCIIMLKH